MKIIDISPTKTIVKWALCSPTERVHELGHHPVQHPENTFLAFSEVPRHHPAIHCTSNPQELRWERRRRHLSSPRGDGAGVDAPHQVLSAELWLNLLLIQLWFTQPQWGSPKKNRPKYRMANLVSTAALKLMTLWSFHMAKISGRFPRLGGRGW